MNDVCTASYYYQEYNIGITPEVYSVPRRARMAYA